MFTGFSIITAMKEIIAAIEEVIVLKGKASVEPESNTSARLSLLMTLSMLLFFGIIEFFTDDLAILFGAVVIAGFTWFVAFCVSIDGLAHSAKTGRHKDLAATALIASVMGGVIILGFYLSDMKDSLYLID